MFTLLFSFFYLIYFCTIQIFFLVLFKKKIFFFERKNMHAGDGQRGREKAHLKQALPHDCDIMTELESRGGRLTYSHPGAPSF